MFIVNNKDTTKLFLKISQYSQENSRVGASFGISVGAFRHATLLKRDSNTDCFGVYVVKFFRTVILKNIYFRIQM